MIDINTTAEQLIKETLKTYRAERAEPEVLLAKTIATLHPGINPDVVSQAAQINSIAKAITKLERDALAHESVMQEYGQLSLLGALIPEHKVPKGLINKSAAEMDAWMASRAETEAENAEELRKAAEAQARKADRFAQWSGAVHRVCTTLKDHGIDPEAISYAEALRKAEAFNREPEPVSVA